MCNTKICGQGEFNQYLSWWYIKRLYFAKDLYCLANANLSGGGVVCKYGVKYTTMMFSPAFITVPLSGFDLRGYDRLIGRSGDGCHA